MLYLVTVLLVFGASAAPQQYQPPNEPPEYNASEVPAPSIYAANDSLPPCSVLSSKRQSDSDEDDTPTEDQNYLGPRTQHRKARQNVPISSYSLAITPEDNEVITQTIPALPRSEPILPQDTQLPPLAPTTGDIVFEPNVSPGSQPPLPSIAAGDAELGNTIPPASQPSPPTVVAGDPHSSLTPPPATQPPLSTIAAGNTELGPSVSPATQPSLSPSVVSNPGSRRTLPQATQPKLSATKDGSQYSTPLAIVRQSQTANFDGTFSYSFETENGISTEVKGRMKTISPGVEAQVMEGQYSYTAPDGTTVVTRWFADETGFHKMGAYKRVPI